MATLTRDCTGVELIVTSQQCKYSYQLVTSGDSFINLEIIPGTVTIQESESSLWSANKFYEVETLSRVHWDHHYNVIGFMASDTFSGICLEYKTHISHIVILQLL